MTDDKPEREPKYKFESLDKVADFVENLERQAIKSASIIPEDKATCSWYMGHAAAFHECTRLLRRVILTGTSEEKSTGNKGE